jgi:COP9 signalosome complex subunit 12
LTEAYNLSLASSTGNIGLILSYLLPIHLISERYPSPHFLAQFPKLQTLYAPLFQSLHTGNLALFDSHTQAYLSFFLRKRVYLAIERSRQCCLRRLFERAVVEWGAGTRVPIEVFGAALRAGGSEVEREETECFVANMIYRGWIRGYISRERGMVVLSAKESFPKVSGSVTWMKI